MAAGLVYERRWPNKIESFVVDGSATGQITVSDSTGFFVKQRVSVSATGLDTLSLEVKRVDGATTLFVGPTTNSLTKNNRQQAGQSIDARTNVSAYTVALNAQITAAEQKRPNIAEHYVIRAVFQEEPAVAFRVLQVDKLGNPVSGSGGVGSNVNVSQWGGAATSLGQKTMAESVPVVLSSNQSVIPVSLDQDLEAILPQINELLAGAITASTPATANTVLTTTADKTIVLIKNTLNRRVGITVGSSQWLALGPGQGASVGLGASGKKISLGTTIGVFYESIQPRTGRISISVV